MDRRRWDYSLKPEEPEGITIRIIVDILTKKGTVSMGASITVPFSEPCGEEQNQGMLLLSQLVREALETAQQRRIL
jgi:hypothetical protein